MKDTSLFFNPFRLISPKLDTEASRLEEMFDTPPEEVTCLEEGLLVMMNNIIKMTKLVSEAIFTGDTAKMEEAHKLGEEIHSEEKQLTDNVVVCAPQETSGEMLRAVVLFPGHLERVGDHLESILNVSRIKAKQGVLFIDKTNQELTEIFEKLIKIFTDFKEALATQNRDLLNTVIEEDKNIRSMIWDFQAAYEDRLLEGVCSPKSASLMLDILDSVRYSNTHIRDMAKILLDLDQKQS
jgi:Na+/phosphate symporter